MDASACRWVSVYADALGWRYFCVSLQGRAGRDNARSEVHAWRYTQGPVGESGVRGRRGVYEACSVRWAEEATCAGRGCGDHRLELSIVDFERAGGHLSRNR